MVATAHAQEVTDERIELRLRVRNPNGSPVVGFEIGLTRVWDNAPMGSRITDANGEAVWHVAPQMEFQYELPSELAETLVQELGEQGFTGLGVYTGWAGEITEDTDAMQPILMGIVLSNQDGTGFGNFAYVDKTPDQSAPSPSIPGVTSPLAPVFESATDNLAADESATDQPSGNETTTILTLPTPTPESTPLPDQADDLNSGDWGVWVFWLLLILLLGAAAYWWLLPAFR